MHNFFTQFNFQLKSSFLLVFSSVRKCLNTFLHSAYFGKNNLLVLFGDKIKLGRKCHHFIYSALRILLLFFIIVITYYVCSRCLVGSTDQACSSGFYLRIAWKSTEQPCFLQNHSLLFLQGLRSLKNWLLRKLSMKVLDQEF